MKGAKLSFFVLLVSVHTDNRFVNAGTKHATGLNHRRCFGAGTDGDRRCDKLVFFLHLHKAGGTTILQYLRDIGLAGPKMAQDFFPRDPALKEKWYSTKNDRLKVFSSYNGTSRLGDPALWEEMYQDGVDYVSLEYNLLQPDAFYSARDALHTVTSFRDPWARYRSTYEMEISWTCRKKKKQQQQKRVVDRKCVKEKTLERWMKTSTGVLGPVQDTLWGAILHPNYYTRMLNGINDRADVTLTREHLDKAKQIVSTFELILILEENDEKKSSQLEAYFGESNVTIQHLTNNKLKDDPLYEEIRLDADLAKPLFDKENEIDIELFEFVQELVAKRSAAGMEPPCKDDGCLNLSNSRDVPRQKQSVKNQLVSMDKIRSHSLPIALIEIFISSIAVMALLVWWKLRN